MIWKGLMLFEGFFFFFFWFVGRKPPGASDVSMLIYVVIYA